MALYISIDGDNIGDKIAVAYLNNDEAELSRINRHLDLILTRICDYMKSKGFQVIFCAADGIVCKGPASELDTFSYYIKTVGETQFTFSAGIGNNLQSAFFALKYAKAIGKNKVVICEEDSNF